VTNEVTCKTTSQRIVKIICETCMLQVLNYQINQNLRPIHNASVSAGVPIPFQMRDRQ